MGCSQSTAAAQAAVSCDDHEESLPVSTTREASVMGTITGTPAASPPPTSPQPAPPAENVIDTASSTGASAQNRTASGKQPPVLQTSLSFGLSSLHEEMVGDLTKAVVRFQTYFGQPIEEVYDGVHDGPILGQGVSGLVRLVTHKTTKVKYAVKILVTRLLDSTDRLQQLRNEIFIMCQLDHPNIVRIEEVYESPDEIYIVQELCVGGDLFDGLNCQPDLHYSETDCAHLVRQMLSSVKYLHSKGIIHRDLKLENFLFASSEENCALKMIDFGLSKHFINGQQHDELVGTPYTVAPEILRGKYDEESDVWSLGVIAYVLLSGETPFGGLDGESIKYIKDHIMRAQPEFEPEYIWKNVSHDAIAFVKRLLQKDPASRPSAKEAQHDKWIQEWGSKDSDPKSELVPKTIGALQAFNSQSDMQKLLSEVLSFTLLPEQVVDLRAEFENIDKEGDGEISLSAMKNVLMQSAETGTLGALSEQEVEVLFESIRVRKSEPTIRWHEFLAAGMSQAGIDDRNLRLAFDRMDTDRKGFVTLEDLRDLLGSSTESELLEKVWLESLDECHCRSQRITYEDFKRLMESSPKKEQFVPLTSLEPKSDTPSGQGSPRRQRRLCPARSRSFDGMSLVDTASLTGSDDFSTTSESIFQRTKGGESKREFLENSRSPRAVVNRYLYRGQVPDASIAPWSSEKDINARQSPRQKAGLIMKRGESFVEIDPKGSNNNNNNDELHAAPSKRRGRKRRTKAVSDLTGILIAPTTAEVST